jgi:hypothetical protein
MHLRTCPGFANWQTSLACLGLVLAAGAMAHTLPISYLYLASDADYLHCELTLNPFELSFFSEIDRNHNRRLEAGELAATERVISKRILGCLKIEVDGKPVPAEVAGLNGDQDSHHVTLRAHYRVDARSARLRLESTLSALTSGSHVTQVTFRDGNQSQVARLDMQSTSVTFEPRAPPGAPSPAQAQASPALPTKPWWPYLALAAAATALGLVILLRATVANRHAQDNTL